MIAMNDSFFKLLASDPLQAIVALALWIALFIVFGLLPVCAIIYGFYFLLTLPLRRNERARFFLDLLELGIKDGRTPEAAIAGATACADRTLGTRSANLASPRLQTLVLPAGFVTRQSNPSGRRAENNCVR